MLRFFLNWLIGLIIKVLLIIAFTVLVAEVKGYENHTFTYNMAYP